jgi:indole-3-acetate monooxygenase
MTTHTETTSPEEIVTQIEPTLRRFAPQAEAERRLAPEAMTAMVDAGVFRSLVPRAYGGLELNPVAALSMFEAIARIDSAAGWLAANQSGIATLGSLLPAEGSAEMFADPRTVCAGAWFPPGVAEPVQGGCRVTARWAFGSGCHYATWLTGQALVHENGAPRLGPDGNPEALIVFVRADEAEVVDGSWKTLGMRGTGSNDYRVNDVFVPDRRVWRIGPGESPSGAYAGPLYRLGLWLVGPVNGAVALGIVQAALDDLIALTGVKTPSYTQTGLADKPVVQERVARARAYVEAARSYLHATVGDAWDAVQTTARLDIPLGISTALSGSFAMEAATTAVDLVHASAGTTAIREEQRFQQYFRDVHTISQHAFSSASRFESLGKLILGRETDWAFYYL